MHKLLYIQSKKRSKHIYAVIRWDLCQLLICNQIYLFTNLCVLSIQDVEIYRNQVIIIHYFYISSINKSKKNIKRFSIEYSVLNIVIMIVLTFCNTHVLVYCFYFVNRIVTQNNQDIIHQELCQIAIRYKLIILHIISIIVFAVFRS